MLHKYPEIQKYIEEVHTVTVKELCEQFGISVSTARRVLIELEEKSIVRRMHGGATLLKSSQPERPIHRRTQQQEREKKAIAKAAAETVCEGDAILLMSGSTVNMMAPFLKDRSNITVLTNSIVVMNELLESKGVRTVFLGGVVDKRELRVVGEMTTVNLKNLRAAKVYFSGKAADPHWGILSDNLDEVPVYDMFLNAADSRYLLLDHTKFYEHGITVCAHWNQVTRLITDSGIAEKTLRALRAMNVEVLQSEWE